MKTDLEKQIARTIQEGIQEAIVDRLTRGYNDNPLNKLIDSIVVEREGEMRSLVNTAFDKAFSQDFGDNLQEAFQKKVAKLLISKIEGETEKSVNTLRSSPEFRAEMTLAVNKVVKNFNKKTQ